MLEFNPLPTLRPPIMGSKYMVVSGHYLATMAGIRILEKGGNVVDAGVAVGLCINVLQPDMTNLGGVAPIILSVTPSREVVTISGLGRWPRAATLEAIRRRGGDISGGILATVTPSALDAWIQALAHYGTMPFVEVAAPAIELAGHGFAMNRFLYDNLSRHEERLAQVPSAREVFLSRGRVPRVGERLVQRDLSRTLRMLAEAERGAASREKGLQAIRDLFYRGDLARRMVAFNQEMGGLLSLEDLAGFEARIEPPACTTYRGYEVYACGPWCQGPVALEALNILEGYDIPSYPHNSATVLHLIVEALKAAFADRHAYYGDPEFVTVPLEGLLSKAYAAAWRDRISLDRAVPEMPDPGDPWAHQRAAGKAPVPVRPVSAPGPDVADTSYLCVMDRDGNVFSATPSDGVLDAPVVPGLGIIVSTRGRQSWVDPDHPSCAAPGKRPRLTPSPGLVMKDGRAFAPYGTPGHDVQPQAMVQMLLNLVDYGMDPQEAVEAPRVATYSFPGSAHPHPYHPGVVRAEARIPELTIATLGRMGHKMDVWPEWTPQAGALCTITLNPEEGVLAGAADPRRLAYAIGW